MKKGTSVYVPTELKTKIVELSKKTGKRQWRLLLDALALYETQIRKPRTKEQLPEIDKVVWYIEKLGMSIGALKESPTNETQARTMKTIQQIRERLNVDLSLLEKAVTDYIRLINAASKDPDVKGNMRDEATAEINMALKTTLIDILFKHILKEETVETNQEESQAS
jgi:hypothetical protein